LKDMEILLMKKLYTLVGLIALTVLGACQTQEIQTTLEAGRTAYAVEAAAITVTTEARGTNVAATAQMAQTQVMQINSVNQYLLATVIAGNTPTLPVVPVVVDSSSSSMDTMGEATSVPSASGSTGDLQGMQFTEIGTSAEVRDSDGCPDAFQTQFSSSAARIYVTSRILNLRGGTALSAEWSLEGTVVVTNTPWTAPQDESSICVWFYIDPATVTFTPGNWSVRLLANNTPIEPAANFTIAG
jgi:hypothetical protein